MIQGDFGSKGELLFEIDLIAVDGAVITVEALLDTGFTDWLAMDIQDVESLGWQYIKERQMNTARGETQFSLYGGIIIFDNQQLTIPVLATEGVPEILIGLAWLETKRLVVDRKARLLTLG